MKEFKGTKGEFTAQKNGYYWEVIRKEDYTDNRIHTIQVMLYDNNIQAMHLSEENEANAKLIAARLDLLVALQNGVQTLDILLMEIPKEDVLILHEVKSRKKQFLKAIKKALG